LPTDPNRVIRKSFGANFGLGKSMPREVSGANFSRNKDHLPSQVRLPVIGRRVWNSMRRGLLRWLN